MTSAPICSDLISLSPRLSNWRTMPETMRSMRSLSTGLLRRATATERASLSRSKGVRRPERFKTLSSRNCTRSNVVNLPPQSAQTRRRRMAEESSVDRESFTCVSALPQKGQRMGFASGVNREAFGQGQDFGLHNLFDFSIACFAMSGKAIQHFNGQPADVAEFCFAETARCASRRSQPDA